MAQTWSTLAPLLYARGDNAFVTLPGDRLFVMGGETGDVGDNRTSVRACSQGLGGGLWVDIGWVRTHSGC